MLVLALGYETVALPKVISEPGPVNPLFFF